MADAVLVGIDGSGPSDAALEWAIERAVRLDLDLVLLHASDRSEDLATPSGSPPAFLLGRTVDAVRTRPGLREVRGLAVEGDAMAALIAASADAAIVVVGSHKTGFLRGRLFGSRSLRLAAGALRPVAIVPEPSGRSRRGVTVGVADTPAGEGAVRFAATEAAALGEELILIHGGAHGLAGDADTTSARVLASARDLARATEPGLSIRTWALSRPAAVALADAAPTSLVLVLAASSGLGADRAVGRTTHDVLMNLAGPTVVVPT